MSDDRQADRTAKWPYPERLAAILGDSLRIDVLTQCNLRAMSPRSFHREVGGATLTRVARAFDLLAQYEWLERTGGEDADAEEVDRLYRGTGPPIVYDETWEELPDSTRALATGRVFETLVRRTKRAMKEGTINARPDAHLTWTMVELDRQGWDEAIGQLNAVFEGLGELERRARARLAESGEEPIAMTVGLLGYESPREGPKGS